MLALVWTPANVARHAALSGKRPGIGAGESKYTSRSKRLTALLIDQPPNEGDVPIAGGGWIAVLRNDLEVSAPYRPLSGGDGKLAGEGDRGPIAVSAASESTSSVVLITLLPIERDGLDDSSNALLGGGHATPPQSSQVPPTITESGQSHPSPRSGTSTDAP